MSFLEKLLFIESLPKIGTKQLLTPKELAIYRDVRQKIAHRFHELDNLLVYFYPQYAETAGRVDRAITIPIGFQDEIHAPFIHAQRPIIGLYTSHPDWRTMSMVYQCNQDLLVRYILTAGSADTTGLDRFGIMREEINHPKQNVEDRSFTRSFCVENKAVWFEATSATEMVGNAKTALADINAILTPPLCYPSLDYESDV